MSDSQKFGLCEDNLRIQKYVAILGITLMSMKFIAWLITDSVSILTDALESIVNVIAALVGVYALYLSCKPRDVDHPYGHGKVELISSSVEGVMIIVAGIMILMQSVSRLLNPQPVQSLDIGLVLIIVAAVANYVAGRYAIIKGKTNRSVALVASGKHLCSDTYSSAGIIIGLGLMLLFSHLGYDVWWIDPIVAAIFGCVILVTGAKVVRDSMNGVMDRMDEQTVNRVIEIINVKRHDHWIDIHNLRVIKHGPMIHIEMHIVLPLSMTLIEQDREFNELKDIVISEFGEYVDLILMGESCNGNMCRFCNIVCDDRKEGFQSLIEWDIDTVTDETEDHSEHHFP